MTYVWILAILYSNGSTQMWTSDQNYYASVEACREAATAMMTKWSGKWTGDTNSPVGYQCNAWIVPPLPQSKKQAK